ncbi:zf-CCHC domain-containing protein [Tanacetum coccineum]
MRKQRKEAEGSQDETTHEESIPTTSNDPPPNGEDRMQLSDLMLLCTNLQKQVLNLEKARDAQAKEIDVLKKRVQKLEKRKKSRTTGLKRLRKVGETRRIESSEDVEQSTKVDVMEVSTAEPVTTAGEVVTTASDAVSTTGVQDSNGPTILVTTAATTSQISKDELTLAQTLIEIKAAKPKVFITAATTVSTESKAKGVSIQNPSETTTRAKDQIAIDAELAFKLHAEEQAELEKIQKERKTQEEANIAIIEKWNEVQAKMEADMELAQRLQSKEQEQYTDEEKAKLFMELLEKKRKLFARKREIEKRSRPPTKAQQRNLIWAYLKNIDGWKLKSLKNKSFSEVQKLFDSAMKRVNTFVDMDTEIVEKRSRKTQAEATGGSSKRVGDELESDVSKKQKVDEQVEDEKDDD